MNNTARIFWELRSIFTSPAGARKNANNVSFRYAKQGKPHPKKPSYSERAFFEPFSETGSSLLGFLLMALNVFVLGHKDKPKNLYQ